ncbi:MAG: hypothetical protein M3122_09645 [Actinomycetota bacterium]|nr:hypothetical protein [Actinomycetota bacterium]
MDSDRHEAYLADKGFAGIEWERRWLKEYGALTGGGHPEEQRPPVLAEGG